MDLIARFQDLAAQVPEILQPLIIALAGAVPFIEGEGAAAIGIVGGLHPAVAIAAGALGNFLCVAVLVIARRFVGVSMIPALALFLSAGTRVIVPALAVALLATADGTGIVTENIFDNRFAFVDELHRMGADIRTEGRHAVVRGVPRLSGAPVRALDVRAGAALVIAALAAEGETTVLEAHHVDRGYPDLAAKLASLGADVERRPA